MVGVRFFTIVRVWHSVIFPRIAAVLMIAGWVAPAAATVAVKIDPVTARAGEEREIVIRVTANQGESVVGMQWDLVFDPGIAPVAVRSHGGPDCEVDAGVNKRATAFAFRPPRCNPRRGECVSVRAVVIALDNVDAIQSGAPVVRCRVAVGRHVPPGRYPLALRSAAYSPPEGGDRGVGAPVGELTVVDSGATPSPAPGNGNGGGGCQMAPTSGAAHPLLALVPLLVVGFTRFRLRERYVCAARRDRRRIPGPTGRVIALLGPVTTSFVLLGASPSVGVVRLEGGEAVGRPGEGVTIAVSLNIAGGERAAGTQNDLRIDTRYFAFVVQSDGTPACTVNPAIGKNATAFGLRPRGCGAAASPCVTVRALVLALDNVEPLISGSVLYSCVIHILPIAPPGAYDVSLDGVLYAAPPPEVGDRHGTAVHARIVVQPALDPADVNCDGVTDAGDLRAVHAAVFGGPLPCRPDCNADGRTSAADLVCVERHLASRGYLAVLSAHEVRRWVRPPARRGTGRRFKEGR